MSVQTPQLPADTTEVIPDDLDAGVIEDARARQRKYRTHGVALTVAVISVGALAVGLGGGGGSGTGPAGSAHAAGAGPSSYFRLLRTQRSSLPVPRWVLRSLSVGVTRLPSPKKEYALDIPAARGTELSGGVKVWLIPGRSGSCLAVSGPGASGAGCRDNDKDVLLIRGFEQYQRYTRDDEKQAVVGIAPDGVHVTFQLSDGSSVPARLNSDNAYVIVPPTSDPVVQTTFTGNGRTLTATTG
jgi:hypothetical protein